MREQLQQQQQPPNSTPPRPTPMTMMNHPNTAAAGADSVEQALGSMSLSPDKEDPMMGVVPQLGRPPAAASGGWPQLDMGIFFGGCWSDYSTTPHR